MENRELLDNLVKRFSYWLHIENPQTIYTLVAAKITHQLPGDPVWLMVIGPSSDGKTELLKAFTQQGEHYLDDLTSHTFVTGYISKKTDHLPQYAERLANSIWYIYDMSIILNKGYEERGEILSQLRQIYDGRLVKPFGNKTEVKVDTPNNTLICGSTPAIDATILEDQIMGTRFLTWRTETGNRQNIMNKIDEMEATWEAARPSLKVGVEDFFTNVKIKDYTTTDIENTNLQTLANHTTLMRTSVQLDRNKELSNPAYPEAPGRFYKQIRKIYRAYRVIGLTEEEALACIRKLCVDCILPNRLNVLRWLVDNNRKNRKDQPEGKTESLPHSTSEIMNGVQMGFGACKSHLSCLMGLGLVHYERYYDLDYRREIDRWTLLDGEKWNLLLAKAKQEVLQ